MKRRNFLQWCLGVLGVVVACVRKPGQNPQEHNAFWGDGSEFLKPGDALFNHQIHNGQIMDFSPDEVISIERFGGRCLIFCKHSIWELEDNRHGGLQRKLLLYEPGCTS